MEDSQCVQSLQVVQAVVHVADLEGGVASSQRIQEVHRRAALVTAQRCNVLEHANAVRLANSRDDEELIASTSAGQLPIRAANVEQTVFSIS